MKANKYELELWTQTNLNMRNRMDNETAAWQLEFVAKPDLPKWVICSYSTNSNSTSRDVGAFLRPKKRGPSYANWGDVEGEEEEEQGEEGRRKITYSGSLYVGSMGWGKTLASWNLEKLFLFFEFCF